MRTTFDFSSPRSRPRRSGLSGSSLRAAAIVLLIALILLALDSAGVLAPVKSQVQAVLQPSERALTRLRVSVGTQINVLFGASELQQRVAELEREVSALREANIRMQGMQRENNQLKLELGIRQTYDWTTISAEIVQANMVNGRRIVRIDQGRVDGVELGMPVVSKEGGSPAALIGLVDTLYAQTADVLLITDYASAISAMTTQPVPAKGLVSGQWQVGSRIRLVDVDPSVGLANGDYVVTAGLSKGLATDTPIAEVPAHIPIGTVTGVERTNHVQSAEVQPFVDPDRVRTVWVITGQK
jgi:rod shape-determining protein MreC